MYAPREDDQNHDRYSPIHVLDLLSDRDRVRGRDFDGGGVCAVVTGHCLIPFLSRERLILGLRIELEQRVENDCARVATVRLGSHLTAREEVESRVLLLLGNRFQKSAVAVVAAEAEDKFEVVAFVAEQHTMSRTVAVCWREMEGCAAVVAMVVLEAAGTVVAGEDMQLVVGCDTVGRHGCLDSTRQKPSCFLASDGSTSEFNSCFL